MQNGSTPQPPLEFPIFPPDEIILNHMFSNRYIIAVEILKYKRVMLWVIIPVMYKVGNVCILYCLFLKKK